MHILHSELEVKIQTLNYITNKKYTDIIQMLMVKSKLYLLRHHPILNFFTLKSAITKEKKAFENLT